MSALPEGWESDYDGARWFFKYKATGMIQYHFPKPGDEYPQIFDNFGPVQQTYQPTPEERLEINRQGQVRRQSSQNSTQAREASIRANGAGATMGASDLMNSFDTFGYFGPGSAADVSPAVDEDGQPRPGSNLTTPSLTNSHLAGSPAPHVSELSSTNIVVHELADASTMGGRHYASDPVGNVMELPTEQTRLCAEEANPAPVELASNDTSFGGVSTFPAGVAEMSGDPVQHIQPAQATKDVGEAQPVQIVQETTTPVSQPPSAPPPAATQPLPLPNMQQDQTQSTSIPQAQQLSQPQPGANQGAATTEGVLPYRPFRATSISTESEAEKRSSVVSGNMTVAESQNLEMAVGNTQMAEQSHGAAEKRELKDVPLSLQPAHDPRTVAGSPGQAGVAQSPDTGKAETTPAGLEKQRVPSIAEYRPGQPMKPTSDVPTALLPAHSTTKPASEPAPNAVLSHVPSVLRPAGSGTRSPDRQTTAPSVPSDVPAALTVGAPRPSFIASQNHLPASNASSSALSSNFASQQEPPTNPGIHRMDTGPLKLPSAATTANDGSGPEAGEFRQHSFSVDFGILSASGVAGTGDGTSTVPDIAAQPMDPGLAPAPLRFMRQTPPGSRTSTPQASGQAPPAATPPTSSETGQAPEAPVMSASFGVITADAAPVPLNPRSPSPQPIMSASFASIPVATSVSPQTPSPAAVQNPAVPQPSSRNTTPAQHPGPPPAMGNSLPSHSGQSPAAQKQQQLPASTSPLTPDFVSVASAPATSMPSSWSTFVAPAPLAVGAPLPGPVGQQVPQAASSPGPSSQQTPPPQAYSAHPAQVHRNPTRRKPVGGHVLPSQSQPGTPAPGTAAAHRMSVSSVASQNWATPASAQNQSPAPEPCSQYAPPRPGQPVQSQFVVQAGVQPDQQHQPGQPVAQSDVQPAFQPGGDPRAPTPAHSIHSQSPQLSHHSPALSVNSLHRNSVSGQPVTSAASAAYGTPTPPPGQQGALPPQQSQPQQVLPPQQAMSQPVQATSPGQQQYRQAPTAEIITAGALAQPAAALSQEPVPGQFVQNTQAPYVSQPTPLPAQQFLHTQPQGTTSPVGPVSMHAPASESVQPQQIPDPNAVHRVSISAPQGQQYGGQISTQLSGQQIPGSGVQSAPAQQPAAVQSGQSLEHNRREAASGQPSAPVQGAVSVPGLSSQQPFSAQQYATLQPGILPGQYISGSSQSDQPQPGQPQLGMLQPGKPIPPALPPRNTPTPLQQAAPNVQPPHLLHAQTMPSAPQPYPSQQPPHPQHSQTMPAVGYQPSASSGPAMGPQVQSPGGYNQPSFGPPPTLQQGMSFQAPSSAETKGAKRNKLSKLMKNSAVTKTAFSIGGALVAETLGMKGDLGAKLGGAAHDKYRQSQSQNQAQSQANQSPVGPYGQAFPVYNTHAGPKPGIPAPAPGPGMAPGYLGGAHDRAAAGRGYPGLGRGHPAAGRGFPAVRGSSAAAIAGMGRGSGRGAGRGGSSFGMPVAATGAGTALTGVLIHQLMKPGQTPAEQQEILAQFSQAQQEASQQQYDAIMQQYDISMQQSQQQYDAIMQQYDVSLQQNLQQLQGLGGPTGYDFTDNASTTYDIGNTDTSGGFDFSGEVDVTGGGGFDVGTLLQDSAGDYSGNDWGAGDFDLFS